MTTATRLKNQTFKFSIQGLTGETGEMADLLGNMPAGPSADISFADPTAAVAETDQAVWSVSLTADMGQAYQIVWQQGQTLELHQHHILKAGQDIQQLSLPEPEITSFEPDLASYATRGIGVSQETATLLNNMAQLQTALQDSQAEISYTLFDMTFPKTIKLPPNWTQMVADYQAFMQQTFQLLKPTLRVETKVEQTLLAYTLVGLSGDFETACFSQNTPDHTQLHHKILSLSLKSRLALMQLLAQTTAGAVVLAAKFSLPGGPLLALPAAWRYFQDVIAQTREFAALQPQVK